MGRSPSNSDVYLTYGVTFAPRDLHVAAVAWEKYMVPNAALDDFAAVHPGSGVRPNLNTMPTEILDQIRFELRHLIFEEISSTEIDDYIDYAVKDELPEEVIERRELFISYYRLAVLVSDENGFGSGNFTAYAVGLSLSRGEPSSRITWLGGAESYPGEPMESHFMDFDPTILQISTQDADRKIHRLAGDWSLQADPKKKARASDAFWVAGNWKSDHDKDREDRKRSEAESVSQKADSVPINPRFLLVQTMWAPEY